MPPHAIIKETQRSPIIYGENGTRLITYEASAN